jgi:hypothetical protein
MKKALILSDSLALPRMQPEMVRADRTWPFLLREAYPDVYFHQVSIGGISLGDLRRQAAYYEPLLPSLVVVQQGIVDCAPRALGNLAQFFVGEFRILSKISRRCLPPVLPFLRKHRRIVRTSPRAFDREIEALKRIFDGIPILWVGIVPARKLLEDRVPGISRNIEIYDGIIGRNLAGGHLSMEGMPDEGVMSDHHHLNEIGHSYIFCRVREGINRLVGV